MLEFKLAIALKVVIFTLQLLNLYPIVIDILKFKLAIAWKIVFFTTAVRFIYCWSKKFKGLFKILLRRLGNVEQNNN